MMRRTVFGAMVAGLLTAPGAASALVATADYSASGSASMSVASVTFVGGGDASSFLTVSVFGTPAPVTTSTILGTGYLGAGDPAASIGSAGPTYTVDAATSGGATGPFGLSDSTAEATLFLDFSNTSTSAIIVAVDYVVDVSAVSSVVDSPSSLETAFACAYGTINVNDVPHVNDDEVAGDFANCTSPPAPDVGVLPSGSFSFTILGSATSAVDLFAYAEGGALISAVPVPAALPLLAGAMGLLGFMGARRRRDDA